MNIIVSRIKLILHLVEIRCSLGFVLQDLNLCLPRILVCSASRKDGRRQHGHCQDSTNRIFPFHNSFSSFLSAFLLLMKL